MSLLRGKILQARPFYRGLNLSGYDGGGSIYALPSTQAVDYFYNLGMRVFRLPFNIVRMLSAPGGSLNATYLTQYKGLITYILAKPGATAIVDSHSFGRWLVGSTFDDYNGPSGGTEIIIGEDPQFTPAQHADYWVKLATALADPRLQYELINEPFDQDNDKLRDTLNATIAALRSAGFKNLLIVPFNNYSNRASFAHDTDAQGALLNGIVDPANNWAVQYHMYMDAYSPGADTSIQPDFLNEVIVATNWARANKKQFYATEFGAGPDAASIAAVTTFLAHMRTNKDVWLGWTYWTAVQYQDENHGGLYRYQLLPVELGGGGVAGPYIDRPQMAPLFAN